MTNVLSTIGPVTENYSNLKKIVGFSKFVRINGAHNTLKWHKNICELIKKINSNCKILIDLPGIKPRTLNKSEIKIKRGEFVLFFYGKKPKKNKLTQIPISKPLPKFQRPKYFSISDGKFSFKFINKGKNYIIGKSTENFTLLSKKGLNVPFSTYDNNFQEKVYLNFLKKIKNFQVDAIGLSYVQNSDLVKKMKIKSNKIIVSKIENSEGCKNLDEICSSSDIIMIDRGDLAAEIGDNNLFNQTIRISKRAKYYGKLLIMATENLETMILNNAPTKSEIISLSFSKSLNVDYLMLSDETATSSRFQQTLNWLKNFNKLNLQINKNKKQKKILTHNKDLLFENLKKIDEQNSKVLMFTRKGYIIEKILSLHPTIEVVIFTDNQKVHDLTYLRKNATIIKTKKFPKNLDNFIYSNIKKNKRKIFKNKKNIFLLYAAFARKNSRANTFTILEERDFNK